MITAQKYVTAGSVPLCPLPAPAELAAGSTFTCPECFTIYLTRGGRWLLVSDPDDCPHPEVGPAQGPVTVGPDNLETAHACLRCKAWVVPQ